jgi:hypothetical protein
MRSAPCVATERWSTPAAGNRPPEGAAARLAPHNRRLGMMDEGYHSALEVGELRASAGPATQRAGQCLHEGPQHLRGQLCIEGQPVAQGDGKGQHPLAYGDLGQDTIDEVSGRVSHAAAAA